MSDLSSVPRRPGGQPGNANALKHGYYARRLPAAAVADLEEHAFPGLQEEIAVLRHFIGRLVDHSGECSDLPMTLSVVRVLSLAFGSLSRLMRTEQYSGIDPQRLRAILDMAVGRMGGGFPSRLASPEDDDEDDDDDAWEDAWEDEDAG